MSREGLAETITSYASGVLPALILLGLAFGMILAPAINTATTGVRPEDPPRIAICGRAGSGGLA